MQSFFWAKMKCYLVCVKNRWNLLYLVMFVKRSWNLIVQLNYHCERVGKLAFQALCGSGKYPYPPHGWLMEIPRGWEG